MPDLGNLQGVKGEEPKEIEPRHDPLCPAPVRNEVGNPDMESRGHGQQEDQAQVLVFHCLPKQYEGFVKSKWKKSLKRGNPYFRMQESKSYYEAYEAYITSIFHRAGTVLRVCVLSGNPDIAFGWSVLCGGVLHYVYVHPPYRGKGFARLLVPVPVEKISHLTIIGKSIWKKKMPEAAFDMFA